jgi:hypothetical protein
MFFYKRGRGGRWRGILPLTHGLSFSFFTHSLSSFDRKTNNDEKLVKDKNECPH